MGRKYVTRNTWPRYICFADSGRVNRELWKEILGVLTRELDRKGLSKVLLTLDNLDAHVTPGNVLWALNNKIRVFPYPKNTTAFMQALDQTPFC